MSENYGPQLPGLALRRFLSRPGQTQQPFSALMQPQQAPAFQPPVELNGMRQDGGMMPPVVPMDAQGQMQNAPLPMSQDGPGAGQMQNAPVMPSNDGPGAGQMGGRPSIALRPRGAPAPTPAGGGGDADRLNALVQAILAHQGPQGPEADRLRAAMGVGNPGAPMAPGVG